MARVNQALFVSTILLASVQHASGAYACSPGGGKKLKTPDGNCSAGVCDDGSCCTDHVCAGMGYDFYTEYLDATATIVSDCKKTLTDCVTGDCTGTVSMVPGKKCQGACTESDCCTRACTAEDCPDPREPVTGMFCSSATTPCPEQKCCKPLCSDYTCLVAYNEKRDPAGTCDGQACSESDCCTNKPGSCSANTVNCPDGKSKLPTNTRSGDDAVAACCVADTKCSGGGTISRAVGTDIAGSALLFLIAMAVA